jgi:hypothetical protein
MRPCCMRMKSRSASARSHPDRRLLRVVGDLGMRLQAYLSTRTFELIVHSMDIAATVGIRFTPPTRVFQQATVSARDRRAMGRTHRCCGPAPDGRRWIRLLDRPMSQANARSARLEHRESVRYRERGHRVELETRSLAELFEVNPGAFPATHVDQHIQVTEVHHGPQRSVNAIRAHAR